MSDTENELENVVIDPPDNQGGGNATGASLQTLSSGLTPNPSILPITRAEAAAAKVPA